MHTSMFLLLGLSLSVPVLAQEDEARAILQKAVNAHGGEKALAKFAASHSRTKGKLHINGGADFDAAEDLSFPDKYKSVGEITLGGNKVTITQVYNGTNGWMEIMNKKRKLDKAALIEVKDHLHQSRLENPLVPLKEKGFNSISLAR